MNRTRTTLCCIALTVLCGLSTAACGDDAKTAEDACGAPQSDGSMADGTLVSDGTEQVCVYLMVETGFQCPEAMPEAHSYGDFTACTGDSGALPGWFDREVDAHPELGGSPQLPCTCTNGDVCRAQPCVEHVPDPCGERVCGSDGQGGTCGECTAEGQVCNAAGQCVDDEPPTCPETCPSGQQCNLATGLCEVLACTIPELVEGCFVVEIDQDADGTWEERGTFVSRDGWFGEVQRGEDKLTCDTTTASAEPSMCDVDFDVVRDEHGNVVYENLWDFLNEERIVNAYALTYDDADRLVRRETDEGADCTLDAVEEWVYDAEGFETAHRTDSDNNGTWDKQDLTTWTWNADRTVLAMSTTANIGSSEYTWTFDGDGNLLMMVTDNDRAIWTYDEQGRVLSYGFDKDDQDPMMWYAEYDPNAAEATFWDEGRTWGTWDQTRLNDGAGNGWNLLELDQNSDNVVEMRNTRTWDEHGNMVTDTSDVGADGVVENVAVVAYTYDGDGNMLSRETDNGDDGTVDERAMWTYDAAGNTLTGEHDFDGDGTTDQKVTWTYDTDGRVLTEEGDEQADGVVDNRTTWSYEGNVTTVSIDSDADGTADSITVATDRCQ